MSERASGGAGERETGRREGPGLPSEASASAQAASADAAGNAHSPALPLAPSAVITQVLSWLDARQSPPPPELRARMAQALEGVAAETVPGALAEAALACLQDTLAAPEERASALDLLAADALLTYALEAAAELGAETLRRMTEQYGAGTLGSMLPEDEAR